MRYPDNWGEWKTLKLALSGKSLARYGDGEIKLMLGRNAKSQRHHPDLAKALREVVRDVKGPCLPCIPNIAAKVSPKEEFWAGYRGSRVVSLYDTSRAATYGSAFITRPDSAPPQAKIGGEDYFAEVRKLWEGRDVVIVRGSTKSLHGEYMPGAASVEEIRAPRQHAWDAFPDLFDRLKTETSRPVLLCLGATATVLANRLAYEGVHALDLGHIGMFMKKEKPGATSDPD